MRLQSGNDIEDALRRTGELVAFERERYAIVVLGGAALNLLGIVARPTIDVDILAFAVSTGPGATLVLAEPRLPLPPVLARAIQTVARDSKLDPNWMNIGPALQWRQGLPPGLSDRLVWRHYGPTINPTYGLDVGLVSRIDLIFFKVYAAADHATTRSVHYKDLIALAPTGHEIASAISWIRPQNASPEFHQILDDLARHVQQRRDRE
jgi:hypothetical protein